MHPLSSHLRFGLELAFRAPVHATQPDRHFARKQRLRAKTECTVPQWASAAIMRPDRRPEHPYAVLSHTLDPSKEALHSGREFFLGVVGFMNSHSRRRRGLASLSRRLRPSGSSSPPRSRERAIATRSACLRPVLVSNRDAQEPDRSSAAGARQQPCDAEEPERSSAAGALQQPCDAQEPVCMLPVLL